jgi:nucleotidyltransferase/DNA polymerase involved in DNA repair
VAALEAEKASLAARLQDALNREPQVVVQEVVREVVKEVQVERDRLQKIHGIGDVFTRRFNEAGVYTFAQLAALTPDRAREIIKPKSGRRLSQSCGLPRRGSTPTWPQTARVRGKADDSPPRKKRRPAL